jgi:hypothetical protein
MLASTTAQGILENSVALRVLIPVTLLGTPHGMSLEGQMKARHGTCVLLLLCGGGGVVRVVCRLPRACCSVTRRTEEFVLQRADRSSLVNQSRLANSAVVSRWLTTPGSRPCAMSYARSTCTKRPRLSAPGWGSTRSSMAPPGPPLTRSRLSWSRRRNWHRPASRQTPRR